MSNSKIATVDRKQQKDQIERVRGQLLKMVDEKKLTAMLMDRVNPEHFVQACMTHYLGGGSNMMKCDPLSFVKACVEAAQLGLKPDPVLGECYIIPRQTSFKKADGSWDKKWVAQFQMGYRGVAKLVRRSDQVRDISPAVVYANDEFNVLLGTDQRIVHRPYYMLGHNAPGAVIAAYTVVTFKDGATSFRVVPRYDLDRAAEASGNPGNKEWSNVWNKHFDAMSMKTALLRHAKWLAMPDDCLRAVNVDERREMGVPEDVNEFIDAEVTDQRDDGYDDNGDDAPKDPLNTLADDR
jgi:recombination protein RecT